MDVPALRPVLAGLLVTAGVGQLVGRVLLRRDGDHVPGSDGSALWITSHVVLVLAAASLLAAGVMLARLVGPGLVRWIGLSALVIGQLLLLAVLAIDLGVASVEVDVIRALDTWDFVGVVGIVLLLLELRRRRHDLALVADLALLGLAVPPVDGLVVIAACAVAAGFAALAYALATGRGQVGRTWLVTLAVVTVTVYAAAGVVSWQRAALALVVLAWTIQHLRSAARPAAD